MSGCPQAADALYVGAMRMLSSHVRSTCVTSVHDAQGTWPCGHKPHKRSQLQTMATHQQLLQP